MTKTYLIFPIKETKPKTFVYEVINEEQDLILGEIRWHNYWRQYCFFPDGGSHWHKGCLQEIIVFIELIMAEHKKRRQEKADNAARDLIKGMA